MEDDVAFSVGAADASFQGVVVVETFGDWVESAPHPLSPRVIAADSVTS